MRNLRNKIIGKINFIRNRWVHPRQILDKPVITIYRLQSNGETSLANLFFFVLTKLAWNSLSNKTVLNTFKLQEMYYGVLRNLMNWNVAIFLV